MNRLVGLKQAFSNLNLAHWHELIGLIVLSEYWGTSFREATILFHINNDRYNLLFLSCLMKSDLQRFLSAVFKGYSHVNKEMQKEHHPVYLNSTVSHISSYLHFLAASWSIAMLYTAINRWGLNMKVATVKPAICQVND